MCVQPGQGDFSEDCLFLNVWTPAKKAQEKLPVYVFIYGGESAGSFAVSTLICSPQAKAESAKYFANLNVTILK